MNNLNHIYFIGIGGIMMSGLAEMMLNRKVKVSGSDRNNSKLIDKLKRNGAKIYIGHDEKNITPDIDLVVYTSAISDDNPEFVKAGQLGLKIMSRAEFLGELMNEHKHSITVSGTHGKTTTTGMLASVLINSDFDPTIFLGGELNVINGNIKIGKGELLLAEACEYKRNFLNFNPTLEIILNIDLDHLDYYKNLEDIESAFVQYANKLPENGILVVNNLHKQLFTDLKCNVYTFGLDKSADFYAENIEYLPYPKYTAMYHGEKICDIELSVFGEHNMLNSLATIAALYKIGVEPSIIQKGLKDFKGTKRRYELKGVKNGVTIIDDYAHHPTAIKATLKAARQHTNGKIITIFQPHTYTRTIELMDEFAQSFDMADEVLLVDIYAAREVNTGVISSKMLAEKVKNYNKNAIYCESFINASELALNLAKPGDIIITMGAGNVYEVGDLLLNENSSK